VGLFALREFVACIVTKPLKKRGCQRARFCMRVSTRLSARSFDMGVSTRLSARDFDMRDSTRLSKRGRLICVLYKAVRARVFVGSLFVFCVVTKNSSPNFLELRHALNILCVNGQCKQKQHRSNNESDGQSVVSIDSRCRCPQQHHGKIIIFTTQCW